jgi:hypothetical protein
MKSWISCACGLASPIRHPEPSNGLGPCTVRGKAWSGQGPVTSVEVSLTGDGDWHSAELLPAESPYAWQDWTFVWDDGGVGRHTLRAVPTQQATRSPTCRRGTGSATETTRWRSSTSTGDDARPAGTTRADA